MARLLATALTLIAASATLAACGSDEVPEPSGDRHALDGLAFVASEAEGRTVVPGSLLTLRFDDGELSASAGCNRLGGAYGADDGHLDLPGGMQTMMACGSGLDVQEGWLFELLGNRPRLARSAGGLTLAGGDVTVRFTPDDHPKGDPPIAGTDWELVATIERGGTAASLPSGAETPTFTISDAGEVTVFTGCNRGRGEATVRERGIIVFGELATTRRGCPGPAGALERQLLAMLSGKVQAAYDRQRQLTLTKDGRTGLLFRAR
jgi:heat shock protein HslJ